MNDDELRARLARLDPQATASVEPITSPRAQDLLERIMTSNPTTDLDSATAAAPERRTRRVLALGTAATAVAAAVAVGVALAGQDDAKPVTTAKKTTLALTLPDPNALSSCIQFDVSFLKQIPVAFAGTVTSVEGDTVSLDVTKWYAGGSAQVVTLTNPGGNTSVALDGVSFESGKDYLVSADRGNVSGCGFSGEASSTLESAYAEAFGG